MVVVQAEQEIFVMQAQHLVPVGLLPAAAECFFMAGPAGLSLSGQVISGRPARFALGSLQRLFVHTLPSVLSACIVCSLQHFRGVQHNCLQ